jgi:hypothetical protein
LNIPIFHRLRQAAIFLYKGQMPVNHEVKIPSISKDEISEIKSFFPLDKFFILGHARSGTTLLVRLVRLHPQVHCNYQAHFFTRPPFLKSLISDPEVHQWLTRGSNRWNRGQDPSPVILRAAADFLLEREARCAGKTIVGDKSPSNLVHGQAVHLMHAIYPDAKLVYIVRDGRDALLSHRIQAFIEFPDHLSPEDNRIRSDFIKNPESYLRGEKSLFTLQGLENETLSWKKNVSETDHLGHEIYGSQYFSLRYEDLLEKPWEQMSRLWSFLGANPDQVGLVDALSQELKQNPDAEYQEEKAGLITQSIHKGKRGNWREMFTQQDRETFLRIAGDTLANWGYL